MTDSNNGRRPTAQDVARLAGVSQPAVSRAFTEGASIAPDTKEKVLRAARQLGYRPNLIARSLTTNRSRLVGVAMSYLENPFYPAMLERISAILAEAGYRVLLFTSPPDAPCEPLLEEVLRNRVDALILASASITSRFADECRRAGVPVVLVNRRTPGRRTSTVTGMNEAGARVIAEQIVRAGHRRPAFMAGLENASTSRERERGFRDGLATGGLPEPLRVVGHFDFERARAAMRELLLLPDPPDAVFCANDYMALAALQTLREHSSLIPGRDISIVGFDDIQAAAWPGISLSTFSQPFAAMAEQVVARVLEHLRHPDLKPSETVVPGRFIQRESSRPG